MIIRFFQALYFALRMQLISGNEIRYFVHTKRKFLYMLVSETHIKEGEELKFLKMFPNATTISKFRFNFLLVYSEIQLVRVLDDEIADEFEADEENEFVKRETKGILEDSTDEEN